MHVLPLALHGQVRALQKADSIAFFADGENLNVLQGFLKWSDPGSLLIHHLTKQVMDLYEIRDREIAQLKSAAGWKKRQEKVKARLMELVGPFPEKTPLNARITGTIKREGYRIDKIIYEAMPRYFVTGLLYVPDNTAGHLPAVLNVIGHNQESFRNPLYQLINHNLARKGMIVFAIDPPGQGEHVQYFDPTINFSSIGYSVIEHCYFGNQCSLSGSSAGRYSIWEGMRAIDYLLSLKEVDPERIGVAGFSGGGTVTTYISAIDERVKVSIPSSWATTDRRLLEIKGLQDSDSFFPHQLAKGITVEDFLEVRAPKPTLLTFNSRDEYLSIQGAHEAYIETKAAYKAMGKEDNLEMADDDSRHWVTPRLRMAIYKFFMKHFDIAGDPVEENLELLSEEELNVTPTGQIATSYGGDMIFDVNKKESEKLILDLERSRKDIEKHLAQVITKAKKLSGFAAPSPHDEPPFLTGRYQRTGYSVAKYAIMGEGDYPIPILLFTPNDNTSKHPGMIYLDSKGKINEANPGGEIEKFVREGYVVAAADVLGVGETKNTLANREGTADAGNTAMVIGRSVVGIQSADIIRVVDFLKSHSDIDATNIRAIAINEMCIPLFHAAAFDPSIKDVTAIGAPLSYRSVVMNRIYKLGLIPTGYKGTGLPYELDFNSTIAGVLTGYDLPDLIAAIAPRRVALIDPNDYALESAPVETTREEMEFPLLVYSTKGVPENLKIIRRDSVDTGAKD